MRHPRRALQWPMALCAVALTGSSAAFGMWPSFVAPAPEPPPGKPKLVREYLVVDAPTPEPPPEKPKPVREYLVVPLRSAPRTREYLRTAVLRYVCSRDYRARQGGALVECDLLERRDGDPWVWSFARVTGSGEHYELSLSAIAHLGGGFEVHLSGSGTDAQDKPASNPDLSDLRKGFEALLEELAKSPFAAPDDEVLPYQLSYVQADRAVAVLGTLGYPVIEYKRKPPAQDESKTVFDTIFTEVPNAAAGTTTLLSRPLIIRPVDSEKTSLVETATNTGSNPDSELTGGQKIDAVSDAAPQQRLLIVYDVNDRDALDTLLGRLQKEIDVPARQLLIEALVLELDHDRLLDLGVNFHGNKDNSGVSFEESAGAIQPFTFTFDTPHPRTLLEFSTKVRALVDRGQATVLSRPSVFVLDGRQARIKVGDNVPYTSSVNVSNGVVTSATSYLKTGIILNLRPRAAADNSTVTMQVETIISSPGPSRVLADGVLVAPTVQSRQVQTLVRVADDTPFVIGGLISQSDQASTVGIPVLSRIPILGLLFSKNNKVKNRREVIVVITPHIVGTEDDTFAYPIARDAGAHNKTENGLHWPRSPFGGDRAASCKPDRGDPAFAPIAPTIAPTPESLFDSFGAELFRNVYRLRSSDIFDLSFITDSDELKAVTAANDKLAQKLTDVRFAGKPPVDPAELRGEVTRRLTERCAECMDTEQQDTFLTLFDRDVPGEEILVDNMMIRLVERLGFSACVPPRNIIYFTNLMREDLDPKTLTSTEDKLVWSADNWIGTSECLQKTGHTLFIAFPPSDDDYAKFRRECLGDDPDDPAIPLPNPAAFSVPAAALVCLPLANEAYLARLHACNERKADGSWRWQAILLNRDFTERRDRNPIALLQSVLALKRLLALNRAETFPRTLRAFHVGRELVFPTQEDLQTRKHVLDRKTARLFYETLNYYQAFQESFTQKTERLKQGLCMMGVLPGETDCETAAEPAPASAAPPVQPPAPQPSG